MALYLTKKSIFLRLFFSPLAAIAALVVCGYFLLTPPQALGAYFDFLLQKRPAKPISKEIVLLVPGNSRLGENVIEASTAAQVIMTLTEMEAASLLIQVPVLGVSTGNSANDSELFLRFDEEFSIISGNVRNLFDGIKAGSVAPNDAGRMVNEVLALTDAAKERLLTQTVKRDEHLSAQMESIADVFGAVFFAGDSRFDVVRKSDGASSAPNKPYAVVYANVRADADGRLRRAAPVLTISGAEQYEHIVFSALKLSFENCEVRQHRFGKDLVLTPHNGVPFRKKKIQLDNTGALVFTRSMEKSDFKQIRLDSFIEYGETDNMLYRLLSESAPLAKYGRFDIDTYPPFLYEKALAAQETLLNNDITNKNEKDEIKQNWISLRNDYFLMLGNFFDRAGTTRQNIVFSFNDLIDDENLSESGTQQLEKVRDELLEKFDTAKELYERLSSLRQELEEELVRSFCILGSMPQQGTGAIGNAKVSALLADSLLTGSAVQVVPVPFVLALSAVFILFSIVFLLRKEFLTSLLFCIIITFCLFCFFSYLFIITGFWIDPFIPAGSTACGAFVSAVCAFVIKRKFAQDVKKVYGSCVNSGHVRKIIGSGKPPLLREGKVQIEKAVFLVIRNPNLAALENRKDAEYFNELLQKFRETVYVSFISKGACLAGCSSDSVTIVYGSPVERLVLSLKQNAVIYNEKECIQKAVQNLTEILKDQNKTESWDVGIDYGECAFSYTRAAGYTAAGSAVLRASLLSTLCRRFNAKILVSKNAGAHIDETRRRTAGAEGEGKELFYELLIP
ncbi:hypothetical protein FACS1894190_04910 [Spirochaetia bacterium]|nr:hypothetical protein FACS1894190_04910 [Spirochaetia bacterium]